MKRTILLVDDHRMARKSLRLYLEHLGYVCEEVEHGAEALLFLEGNSDVKLVISDNRMPIMTGMELLKKLKQDPSLNALPVILFSGNLIPELSEEARHFGAFAVLGKPYDFSDLASLITKVFES